MVHQRVAGSVGSEGAPAIHNWNEVYAATATPSSSSGDTDREPMRGRDADEYYAALRTKDNIDEYD